MDGTLLFTSPGQTVVFQEYGEPFRPAEGNWAVMVHPDFIRGTAPGRDIGNYVFFSYELHEALHLSEEEIGRLPDRGATDYTETIYMKVYGYRAST